MDVSEAPYIQPLWCPRAYLKHTCCLLWKAVHTPLECCESGQFKALGWTQLKYYSFVILLPVGFARSNGQTGA